MVEKETDENGNVKLDEKGHPILKMDDKKRYVIIKIFTKKSFAYHFVYDFIIFWFFFVNIVGNQHGRV